MKKQRILLFIFSLLVVSVAVSAQLIIVTNIGGGSNSQMCRLSGDPFDLQIQLQLDPRFSNLSNISASTIIGNLTIVAQGLAGTQYQVSYFVDRLDANAPLAYKFRKLDFLPEFIFGVLHFNQRSALRFNATAANAQVTMLIRKEHLNKTFYVQAIALNAGELVLSDGYRVVLPASPPHQNLVAFWNFDEGSGTTTGDLSGNGNTGTLLNGVSWTTDSISGYALRFDGRDDRVSILGTSSLDLTNTVTLEAWVKKTSATDGTIISKNGPYYLAVKSNVVYGGIYSGSSSGNQWTFVRGSMILQQNIWYKLKLIYDNQTINVYVNDVLDGSIPKTGTMPYTGQELYLGWGLPGQDQYFTGILDNVVIYNSTNI